MRVEIIRGVMIKGEPAAVGSIVDLSNNVAMLLVHSNKARLAAEPSEPAPLSQPAPPIEVKRPNRQPRPSKE